MKLSYSWLKQYVDTGLTAEEAGAILTATGLEVEAIERREAVRGGLEGVVVGEVIEKAAHPNADRLSVTRVDVGEDTLLSVVCGAPNVAKGQKVLVATVGATIYPHGEDTGLKIKKSKIRGEESCGMICAEDELGIGESHDGILVLPEDAPVGMPAAQYLNIQSDDILEIGLTPNRTDAFCHFGVARDLAAFLEQSTNKQVLRSPDISVFRTDRENGAIQINVEAPEACIRYAGLLIEGVSVKPSPAWLQERLRSIGITPKNNVVDVTNFVLHELGQPLHAFDADKIRGGVVRVALADEGARFTTLDGIERKLSSEDLMICDADGPMCMAGVLGGVNSGVSEATERIFLESACFDSTVVRKTAKRHQISTDASFRFERGVDPNGVIEGLKRAAILIKEVAGGAITTAVQDEYPKVVKPAEVRFSPDRCNQLIGYSLSEQVIRAILKSLDINIKVELEGEWLLTVPTYRVDVTREADVVEEILRIYGYDNIPIPQKLSSSVNVSEQKSAEYLRKIASDLLVSNGYVQMMSNSLSSSSGLAKLNSRNFPDSSSVVILNPLSSELDIMRQTLLVNMLEAVALNQNHKNPNLRLFELGNVYRKTGNSTSEEMHLGLLLSGQRYAESWNNPQRSVDYFDLKNTLQLILQRFGMDTRCAFEGADADFFKEGQVCKTAREEIAQLGWIRNEILDAFEIDQPVLFCMLNWDKFCAELGTGKVKYKAVSRYPLVNRDFSLLLNSEIKFSDIELLAKKSGKRILKEVSLFDVYEGKNLGQGKKSYAVRFVLGSDDRTLKDAEVDEVMNQIRKALENELGATLR